MNCKNMKRLSFAAMTGRKMGTTRHAGRKSAEPSPMTTRPISSTMMALCLMKSANLTLTTRNGDMDIIIKSTVIVNKENGPVPVVLQ